MEGKTEAPAGGQLEICSAGCLEGVACEAEGCSEALGDRLVELVEAGDLKAVQSLVEEDPGCVFEAWEPILLTAARSGRPESHLMVGVLAKAGASVYHSDHQGNLPLFAAAERGHTLVVEELLKHGAWANDSSWGTPLLHTVVKRGDLETAKMLVEGHALNLDARDRFGSTAVEIAEEKADYQMAKLLLTAGASLPEGQPEDRLESS